MREPDIEYPFSFSVQRVVAELHPKGRLFRDRVASGTP